jgi:curli biogenesis system outer membrane secretion channel CsgG
MKRIIVHCLLAAAAAALLAGCPAGTTTNVRESSGQSMADAQAEAYNGPKARIAVARFDNKTADSMDWYSPSIGDGMADMLTTALVNSGRYIVLERMALDDVLGEQDLGASGRVREETAAEIGEIEGAELLVVAAVTEFSGDAGGMGGSIGGGDIGRAIGALAGGTRKAHMAVDLRVVDARTSRILAATSVEGEASDFDLGGALSGWTGSTSLGGSLSGWKNTPREKALRAVIEKAVDYVISVTPQEMMRFDAMGNPVDATASSGGGPAVEQVVITASSLNVRSGPSTENPVQFSLNSGAVVDVLTRAGEWLQVRDGQGREGWVSAQYTLEVQ